MCGELRDEVVKYGKHGKLNLPGSVTLRAVLNPGNHQAISGNHGHRQCHTLGTGHGVMSSSGDGR